VPPVLGVPLTAVLALALVVRRRNGRAGRRSAASPVETLYVRMATRLARAGHPRFPQMTPGELTSTVPAAARPLVEEVTRLFERERYGAHAATPGEMEHAVRAVTQLAARLRAGRR